METTLSKRANLTNHFMVAPFSIHLRYVSVCLPDRLALIAKAIRLRRAWIYEKIGSTKKVT